MGFLEGKIAVVTGAGSGMGKASAKILAREGAKVILADISGAQEQTAAEIGDAAIPTRCDTSDEAQVSAVIELAVAKFGRLDAILNVAGIGIGAAIDDTSEQDLDRLIGINQKGVYFGAKHAARAMKDNGGGAIINWSSIGGLIPSPHSGAYCMTKAAVTMMTRSFAIEMGKYNIRCNAICPGLMLTEGMGQAAARNNPALAALAPLGRAGQPEEAGELAAFLASDRAAYITGALIPIDGGWSNRMAT
jgi:NAD(P)-dependent dehydrogenase (short-subunit alcohol dehydrogenase family)